MAEKKISRNLAFGVLGALVGVIAIAFIFSVGSGKFERQQAEVIAEQKRKAFETQEPGKPEDVMRQFAEQERILKEQREKMQQAQGLTPDGHIPGSVEDTSPPVRPGAPLPPPMPGGVQAGSVGGLMAPAAPAAPGVATGQPVITGESPAARAMALPEVYERYPGQGVLGGTVPGADLAADAASAQQAKPAATQTSVGSAGGGQEAERRVYRAATPMYPPTRRLLRQGAVIDAVLVNGINTQLPGRIQLRTVADVYDSVGDRELLLPKGTVLIGGFGEPITRAGLDRVPVSINRIVLGDGRAIDLVANPVSDEHGYSGVPAEFHSNLLRAIGPSALVAWIGYKIDKAQAGKSTATTGTASGTQPPNISQQIIPKIEERVDERYGAARPYYTIEPGTRLTLVLSEDVVIPPYQVVR
ncbi:MAG: TrbI/VirB10 family protein [Caldilinea sp.]|nr:TrbI/VirB10 family protein [Caldilinea sp.]MDW8438901.1 TrbI/VirB10 family protein [Caldilineaceae bacterium]